MNLAIHCCKPSKLSIAVALLAILQVIHGNPLQTESPNENDEPEISENETSTLSNIDLLAFKDDCSSNADCRKYGPESVCSYISRQCFTVMRVEKGNSTFSEDFDPVTCSTNLDCFAEFGFDWFCKSVNNIQICTMKQCTSNADCKIKIGYTFSDDVFCSKNFECYREVDQNDKNAKNLVTCTTDVDCSTDFGFDWKCKSGKCSKSTTTYTYTQRSKWSINWLGLILFVVSILGCVCRAMSSTEEEPQ